MVKAIQGRRLRRAGNRLAAGRAPYGAPEASGAWHSRRPAVYLLLPHADVQGAAYGRAVPGGAFGSGRLPAAGNDAQAFVVGAREPAGVSASLARTAAAEVRPLGVRGRLDEEDMDLGALCPADVSSDDAASQASSRREEERPCTSGDVHRTGSHAGRFRAGVFRGEPMNYGKREPRAKCSSAAQGACERLTNAQRQERLFA